MIDDELYVDTSKKFSIPAEERPIGYVFQDYVLFPHLSVVDNVAFGLRMQNMTDEEVDQRVAEALEQVHLVGYDDRHPKELSGGQQQRVAIARALALQPQLLLLDESLSALDIQTRHEVARELREILLRLKLTTVMVSHQYSDALNFADHIIVLEQGRVIQEGAHLDLLRHPRSVLHRGDGRREQVRGHRRLGRRARGHLSRLAARRRSAVVEIEAAPGDPLDRGSEVSVILHPRRVTLHAADPASVTANVSTARSCKPRPSAPTSRPGTVR